MEMNTEKTLVIWLGTCWQPVKRQLHHTDSCSAIRQWPTGHLGYCNGFPAGISGSLIPKLKSIQNAVTRLFKDLWNFDHVSEKTRKASLAVSACVIMHSSQNYATCLQMSTWTGSHVSSQRFLTVQSDRRTVPRTYMSTGD